MVYYLVRLFSSIVRLLPRPIRRLLGEALGQACWVVTPRRRKELAISNIKQGLGYDEADARLTAKRSVTRFGPMFTEVLTMPFLNQADLAHIEIEGEEHLATALGYGRGAVLATAHTGNWELLGSVLAMRHFPLVAVVQKQTNAAMDRFINEYRTRAGMHVTYKSGIREMITLLGQGKIIGLLMDQDAHKAGVFVDFLGRLASTPPGAASLARMKEAPIVPAFITEIGAGRHRVIIHPPVWAAKTKDKEADIKTTIQALTDIISAHVRTYPQEWFWLHNRWKTPPPAGK